jgi:hypothetical protein
MIIILVVCSTGLHSSHGAHRVHQSTKTSHAGKKGYDWSCMWSTEQTLLYQPWSAHQSGRRTIFAICFNRELVTSGGPLLPVFACVLHSLLTPVHHFGWRQNCYRSKWGMSKQVLSTWLPSCGIWQYVIGSVVPGVLKDHSMFIFKDQAVSGLLYREKLYCK